MSESLCGEPRRGFLLHVYYIYWWQNDEYCIIILLNQFDVINSIVNRLFKSKDDGC